jgi:hypothetical protein
VRKDHWKGMSPGQVGGIQAVQLRQVEEARERRAGEKQREQEYDRWAAGGQAAAASRRCWAGRLVNDGARVVGERWDHSFHGTYSAARLCCIECEGWLAPASCRRM